MGLTASLDQAADSSEEPWWHVLVEPTIPIILLAEIAHVARHNWTDVTVFFGVAVLIVVDRLAPVGATASGEARPRTLGRARRVALCCAFGLIVAPMSRGGPLIRLALAIPGVIGFGSLLRHPVAPHPNGANPPSRGWVLWPILFVAGCVFELANFLAQPDASTPNPAHPVLSDLVEPWLASGVARGVFCAIWLGIGLWLFGAITRGTTMRRSR